MCKMLTKMFNPIQSDSSLEHYTNEPEVRFQL
jgi:hypothetical protein